MPQNPEEMAVAMIANLKDKTGKTLPQWLKLAKGAKLEKHGQIVKFLKGEHGMTHGFANLVAHKTLKSDAGSAADAGDLVAGQYSGAKATGRLEASGSFNAMVSHRVRLSTTKDVNKELIGWLRKAYDGS